MESQYMEFEKDNAIFNECGAINVKRKYAKEKGKYDDLDDDLIFQIVEFIKTKDVLDDVSSAAVAKYLNVSKRTLFRKLSKKGVSFSAILKREKKRRFCYLWKLNRIPASDIAIILGYSDEKSFYRAFQSFMETKYSKYTGT